MPKTAIGMLQHILETERRPRLMKLEYRIQGRKNIKEPKGHGKKFKF